MLNKIVHSSLSTRIITAISIAFLFSAMALAGSFDPTNKDEEMQRTLRRMDILVAQISEHAAEVNALATEPMPSFRSQGFELEQAKAELNDFGKIVPQLEKQAKDWRWTEQAVKRIHTRAKELAAELDSAIDRVDTLRSSTKLMLDKQYQANIAAMSRFSDSLDKTLDYMQSRLKMEEEAVNDMS